MKITDLIDSGHVSDSRFGFFSERTSIEKSRNQTENEQKQVDTRRNDFLASPLLINGPSIASKEIQRSKRLAYLAARRDSSTGRARIETVI